MTLKGFAFTLKATMISANFNIMINGYHQAVTLKKIFSRTTTHNKARQNHQQAGWTNCFTVCPCAWRYKSLWCKS
jgi:hypothetical protein